jgi:hypothetical protein
MGVGMNDNLSKSFDRAMAPVPFEIVGAPCRRASELNRDRAALELAAYVIAILKFDAGSIGVHRDELLKRANAVHTAQGNGRIVFVNDTAAAIRAAAEPMSKSAYSDLEAGLRSLLSAEPQVS